MSWVGNMIGQWLFDALQDAKRRSREYSKIEQPIVARSSDDPTGDHQSAQVTFSVLKAANGRIIKVSEFKPTRSTHSDWHHELHIVEPDETIATAVSRVLAIKALEK